MVKTVTKIVETIQIITIKAIKPFMGKNAQYLDSMALLENDRLVTDPVQVATVFNDFQVNITKYIGPPTEDKSDLSDLEFVHHSIDKYQNYSSVKRIREHLEQSNKIAPFSFTKVSIETVETTLQHSNPKKATGYDKFPPHILKEGAKQLAVPITYL